MDERLSAIKQAIQLEDDGGQYYLQATARAQNPLARNTFQWLAEQATEHNAREFYEFLTEEERGHLNLLTTTLEYLDHPDSWYLTEEQWIVEG